MHRTLFAFLPVLALAGVNIGCDDFDIDLGGQKVEAPFHYTYDVQPGSRLEIETFNGQIEIHAWDQNKIDVSGTKYANSAAQRDAIRVEASATPASVNIRVVRPSDHHGSMGAKFVVRVPRDITLDRIITSNGAIRVDDVNGAVHAHTSNGGVNLSHVHGAVDVETSNGAIEVSGLTGNAILHTNNGHIEADHVTGYVEAESSNGSITLNFDATPKNDVHANTSNSSIDISLPASSPFRVRADTSNGSISSDFDVTDQREASKHHLEGTVNGGGPMLALETSNGSIKINKP